MPKAKQTKTKTAKVIVADEVKMTEAKFNADVKKLMSIVNQNLKDDLVDTSEMSNEQILSWISDAEEIIPVLVNEIKSAKDHAQKQSKETFKAYKGTLSVVTSKVEKSKINFPKLRKLVSKQMKRVRNIEAVSPLISRYIGKAGA